MIDRRIWHDQEEFNNTLRKGPFTPQQRIDLTKEFALHMTSEITEMLNASGTWAMHRRPMGGLVNEENIRRQLIDQFKYWMSLCQLWGFSPEQMADTYWRKSATVRARYSEEFLISLDRPAVILDLDNVLCDYTQGFFAWATEAAKVAVFHPSDNPARELSYLEMMDRLDRMRRQHLYCNAENAGVVLADWMKFLHAFRVGGGFALLPAMPGLQQLTAWLKTRQYCVIGLTSRPIDEYPNIIDDTFYWLAKHNVAVDCVWWGAHKGEKLAAAFPRTDLVEFVVDDDPRYLQQYAALGVKKIYWMWEGYKLTDTKVSMDIRPVRSLLDILIYEGA